MAQYTSVNVSPEAAAELRSFAVQVTPALGRRVTMTDALRVAVKIATAHLAEAPATAAALGLPPAPTA